MSAIRFELVPERPYDLERTLRRYARFPEVVDRVEGGAYRRLLVIGNTPTLLRVGQRGSAARAVLEVELCGPGAARARSEAERLVRGALGAGQAVHGFYRAFRTDPALAPAIARERGLRSAGSPSVFEALVTAVLCQQVNLGFAYSIRRELAEHFGVRAHFAGETFVAFPDPATLSQQPAARLRQMRLSAAKTAALLAISQAFANGELVEAELASLPEAEVVTRLCALRGVGRWTAEIALMRGLWRPDVFPAADLGVVKHLALGLLGHREKAGEAEMRAFAESWRPYRSLALLYAYAELAHRQRLGAASDASTQRPRTRKRKTTRPA